MATPQELHDALFGHVRGHPVGITLFYDEIPDSYKAEKVDPCAIVRLAMDDEKICYIDGENQDCTTGAFTAGVHAGTPDIRSGKYLADNIPAITPMAAARGKSGQYVLPQGMLKAIGAAPLNKVPEGVNIDWIVVVCNPQWANWIGGARSTLDGTPPHGAAGTSFCSDLFSVPWHTDNVVITPGDMGGRMNNKLKPEEMFVIVPMKYSDQLMIILTDSLENVNARGTLDATKPPGSPYWEKRKRAEEKKSKSAEADGPQLHLTMDWDSESQQLISKTPAGIIDVAITSVEEFARDNGHDRITKQVLVEQMSSIGMDPEAFLGT